jgi:carbon monoxide dehydrogenase subunit G
LEITGEFRLKGTRQEAWDVLNDPKRLERAIPGTDRLILETPDHYRAEMSVGMGIIRGRFKGSVVVEDKVEPESYRMTIEGKGGAGWMKGSGDLKMTESGESETMVRVVGEATVGGMLGRVGQKMVGNVANSLMKQFFENIDKEIQAARQ